MLVILNCLKLKHDKICKKFDPYKIVKLTIECCNI